MVAPYSQTVQNNAKCPHGFPAGACPICSGMGGGSKINKDRDKKRAPGEMTYNECLAEWHRMQAQKEVKNQAKLQAQAERLQDLKESFIHSRILAGLDKAQKTLDKIIQNIEKLPFVLKVPAKLVLNFIAKPIMNLISKIILSATKNIQWFYNGITNFINSVTEKLAMVFGEIKNFADNAFLNKFKKSIKTLLSLLTEEEEEEASEEAEKLKAREIKKELKRLFRIKNTSKKEEDDKSKITGCI